MLGLQSAYLQNGVCMDYKCQNIQRQPSSNGISYGFTNEPYPWLNHAYLLPTSKRCANPSCIKTTAKSALAEGSEKYRENTIITINGHYPMKAPTERHQKRDILDVIQHTISQVDEFNK